MNYGSYALHGSIKKRVPTNFWKLQENRKKFLDELASKLKLKKPSDWGNVTIQQIHDFGGGSLLNTYYNDSIFACLQSVYTRLHFMIVTLRY